jgi:uncharacterized membrane protein (DUF485 family)
MSDTQSAVSGPLIKDAVTGSEDPLERLLRQQRVLAWVLSLFTLSITVVFFAAMTLAAPLLSRVAFGTSVTVANIAAVTIILLFLASIAVFGWRARSIDVLLHNAEE